MNPAKIRLSQKELDLVMHADWILTKNVIIEKTIMLMASLQVKQEACLQSSANILPAAVTSSTPKISRGEKYQGLPYVMLDYPRLFGQTDIFAIRTLFWWGNFFSVTLHLSGSFKKISGQKILDSYQLLADGNWYYCINDKQWEHELSAGNYSLVAGLDKKAFEKSVREKDFIKLVSRIPLEQWDIAEELLLEAFRQILGVVEGEWGMASG